jgi:hypothetical protein
VDLRRENDVEQLRRIPLAQQVQIEQLLRVLASKCRELDSLKGNPQELQQTLAVLETLTQEARQTREAAAPERAPSRPDRPRKPRQKFGPTEQPSLAIEPELFKLDEPDRTCPSCGGQLHPMKDLVGNYHGVIVSDALKTHEAGARDSPGITLAGCWAHVLRKFEEAAPSSRGAFGPRLDRRTV